MSAQGGVGARRAVRALSVPLAVFVLLSLWTVTPQGKSVASALPSPHAGDAREAVLLASGFIENEGQVPNREVRFYAYVDGLGIGFSVGAVLLKVVPPAGAGDAGAAEASGGVLVRAVFEGANPVLPVGRDPLSHPTSFFIGSDPAAWRAGTPSYREVAYEGLYAGVDAVYRLTENGPKYEFLVQPGADPSVISIRYEGADSVSVDEAGSLVVHTAAGEIHDAGLEALQAGSSVGCTFTLKGAQRIGFDCKGADPSKALRIDPLVYSTFIGGDYVDEPAELAVDASGSVYLVGETGSQDFPVTPGAIQTTHATPTACGFVAKLNATGSALEYATYLCGSRVDSAKAIAIDAAGNAYVTGAADSADFPTTPGSYDRTWAGNDAFVAKLNPTGSGLLYSTFLGGARTEIGWAISVDASGAAYIAGETHSPDFPATAGAADRTCGTDGMCNAEGTDGSDAFIAKLDPTGSVLVYATFLGGSAGEAAHSLVPDRDGSGSVWVAGVTFSDDFPVTSGAFQTSFGGVDDAFVVKVSPAGDAFLFSSYLGGSDQDGTRSIAQDPSGALYVAGSTGSRDFPTTPGAFDRTCGDDGNCDSPGSPNDDTFVTKVSADGSRLVYSTYLGGMACDYGRALAVDASGRAYVSGDTNSPDFPTTPGAYSRRNHGIYDAFLTRLDSSGSSLEYSTFLGGVTDEYYVHVALGPSGGVYLAGSTISDDFPVTPGAFDTVRSRSWDAFVTKLDLAPEPNHPPVLAWTGEANFTGDGLDPEVGTTATMFSYRVLYRDPDNDPPTAIRVSIQKPLGTAWTSLNLSLASWVGSPFNYEIGATYNATTRLADSGTDYWYVFNATDERDWASGPPTAPIDAPDVDNPPLAVAHATPTVGYMGDEIAFDGTASTDDVGIVAYHWDLGDGCSDSNATATHAYAERGTFVAILTVWDTRDQTGTDTVSVAIKNRPPVAEAGPDRPVQKARSAALDGSWSSDPDGDPLTYSWTQIGGPPVTLSGADTVAPTFTPPRATTYTFRLVVSDGAGGTSGDAVNVAAWGLPPIARLTANGTPAIAAAPIALDGRASSDPDGTIVDFAFDFGDGTIANGSVGARDHGYAIPGGYTVTLVVTDDDGNVSSARADVEVTAPPAEPNWKPVVAALFAIALLVVGVWASRLRPWKGEDGQESEVRAFLVAGLPFIAAEIATGVVSYLTGLLSIPPLIGLGSLVDSAILAGGILAAILWSRGGRSRGVPDDAVSSSP